MDDLIKRLEEMSARIQMYTSTAHRPLRTIEEIALRSAALHDEVAAALRARTQEGGACPQRGKLI